ncbi:Gfo/Idh/MocA family oxidoreductase, partial [bacterium]|nr:Gfo/Idh/MocA family oxidoreductase [bacterium]
MTDSKKKNSVSRRTFLEGAGSGAATIAAMTSAPAVWAAGYSPNETIGIAHIGLGVRGGQLIIDAAGEPDKDRPGVKGGKVVAVCDIYKPHLEKGVQRSANKNVKTYHNYEDVLADKHVDAVVIATPDHWHSKITIDAANAGKDIYCEKCWTRTLPELKAMYKAVKQNKTVLQLGHNTRASA